MHASFTWEHSQQLGSVISAPLLESHHNHRCWNYASSKSNGIRSSEQWTRMSNQPIKTCYKVASIQVDKFCQSVCALLHLQVRQSQTCPLILRLLKVYQSWCLLHVNRYKVQIIISYSCLPTRCRTRRIGSLIDAVNSWPPVQRWMRIYKLVSPCRGTLIL